MCDFTAADRCTITAAHGVTDDFAEFGRFFARIVAANVRARRGAALQRKRTRQLARSPIPEINVALTSKRRGRKRLRRG